MPELNRVLAAVGGQARVQVVYDRAFFDALATPHKVFEPLCSYDRYQELLRAADIGLLPLEPTRFNQHKSDLKFIECAANHVAALASPTVYGRTIVHEETGLIYQSPTEFGEMLERLICDSPARRRRERVSICRSESDASTSLPVAISMVSPDARVQGHARGRASSARAGARRALSDTVLLCRGELANDLPIIERNASIRATVKASRPRPPHRRHGWRSPAK